MYKKNSSNLERAASVQGRVYRQAKREIDVPNVTFNVSRKVVEGAHSGKSQAIPSEGE